MEHAFEGYIMSLASPSSWMLWECSVLPCPVLRYGLPSQSLKAMELAVHGLFIGTTAIQN